MVCDTYYNENVLTHLSVYVVYFVGIRMQTYTIYTQCDHCGIYDRDLQWCALCQRLKEAKRSENAKAPDPQKAHTVIGRSSSSPNPEEIGLILVCSPDMVLWAKGSFLAQM